MKKHWKVLTNLNVCYTQNLDNLKLGKLACLVANSFSLIKAHHDATLVVFRMKFLLTDYTLNSLIRLQNALADKSLHLALRIITCTVQIMKPICPVFWDFGHALS